MTHYTVLVALRDPGDLEAALAPFDENLEVAPYPDYLTGKPEEHHSVEELRKDGLLPADGELTWEQVTVARNRKFPDEEPLHTDGERAWEMSTYPPDAKWDWYSVGGRWSGYFPYKEGRAGEVLNASEGMTDGGPKDALDLEKLRADAAVKAGARWDEYHALVDGLPAARSWREYRDKIGEGYTIDQARADYHGQPAVKKIRDSRFDMMFGDPAEEYGVSRGEYAQRARDGAVPGYALLKEDGTWLAPGSMGWFGTSTDEEADRDAYRKAANEYIDSLPGDMYLILVDAHI